jgi:four helix bundle protein
MRLSEDLRKRTKDFASRNVRLYIRLPRNREEVAVLSKQLLRSGTSVAAHAREASRARSDNEFCSKLDVLLQEADDPERSGDRHPFGCPQGDEGINLSYG